MSPCAPPHREAAPTHGKTDASKTHVTLSEQVPPSESSCSYQLVERRRQRLPKKRGGLSRAARFLTCGDPSTRSLCSLAQGDKVGCRWERGSSTTESKGLHRARRAWFAVTGSISSGHLGRRRRPSVAPSARSRGGNVEDCDHADGTPAASLVSGRSALDRAYRGCPLDVLRIATGCVSARNWKNVKDGTPGVAPYARALRGGYGSGPGCGYGNGYGLGNGIGHGNWNGIGIGIGIGCGSGRGLHSQS